jgi:hypothetical protein
LVIFQNISGHTVHRQLHFSRRVLKFKTFVFSGLIKIPKLLLNTRVARWHIFKPKISIWEILEGLAMEDVATFYGHLVYFTAIWYSLWPFDIFSPFWYFVPRKSGNPAQQILKDW